MMKNIVRVVVVVLMTLVAQPAGAECFLFFCWPHQSHHHRVRHHHRHLAQRVIVKKKVVVVHERDWRGVLVDHVPIAPLD